MVDARNQVKEILKADTAVTAICKADDIHKLKLPKNNKSFPCIVVLEDDNTPSMADNKERSSVISMQIWLWTGDEADYIDLIKAVNKAMMEAKWIRVSVYPDKYLPAPLDLYEKMLVFERALLNNE